MREKGMSAEFNISRVLEKAAQSSKTALVYYGRKFSYEDLGKFSRLFAGVFMRLGVKKGERVALMMSNVPQFLFAYYGAILAGAIVTPVNLLVLPRSYRATDKIVRVPYEIREQIKDSAPSIIVAFDFYFPLIDSWQREMEEQADVILTGPQDFMPPVFKHLAPIQLRKEGRWVNVDYSDPLLHKLEELLKGESKDIPPFSSFPGMVDDENELVQLQYTGGTTGTPKGVMLTHKNLLSNIRQANEHLARFLEQGKEVVLGVLPFFHMYGLTAAMQITLLEQNGTLVLVADPQDIKRWVSWIREYEVTVIPSVPRLYERLVSHHQDLLQEKHFSSVKLFMNGAGVLPIKTRQIFENISGAKILEGYGLSEASPVVSVCTPSELKDGSIGKPIPETEVRIVNLETGADISVGEEGEIVVKGPQVMLGYFNKPEETAQVLRDGWLYTGDIGYLDEDGFLYITDRIKDMAKISGENVFPGKIEKALANHQLLKDITIVGVPDEDRGERLVACVVLRDAGQDKAQARRDIINYASENLASFEVPRDIRFVASLDQYKNQLGKVLKRQIREALRLGSM